MGILIREEAVDRLKEAGLRAAEAYPRKKMPQLDEPAVAVAVEKVEGDIYTLRAEVFAPGTAPGTLCEEYAEAVRRVLEGMGAACTQNAITYDGRTDLFAVSVLARFPGEEAKPDLQVKLGEVPLSCVTEFTASRSGDELQGLSMTQCKWTFRIREFFPAGTPEGNTPEEPFTMTVKRTGRTEEFIGCTMTSVKRTDALGGMEQIRTGVAESMQSITII